MGAHTLGGARKGNSGYHGAWINSGPTDFNNVYYQFLTGWRRGIGWVVLKNAVRQIRAHYS